MPGPYKIENEALLTTLPGQAGVIPTSEKVGATVQCVGLVKQYGKCPATSQWKPGALVKDSPDLAKGTAIATFIAGVYPSNASGNHACFFIEFVSDATKVTGFKVLEQHVKPDPNKIQTRIISYGQPGQICINGEAYSVIL